VPVPQILPAENFTERPLKIRRVEPPCRGEKSC
jgi:hypothetical protein